MWWAARHHMRGLPDGVQWWPGAPNAEHARAWLCQQYARGTLLQPGQQQLLDELMLPAGTTPVWQPRISDAAWQTLMPLLPARPPSDGRYRSERQILEAIVHVACTQQSWPQLPQTLGSFKTCRLRYIRWRQDGTLARIATAHLPATDRTNWFSRTKPHVLLSSSHRRSAGLRARTAGGRSTIGSRGLMRAHSGTQVRRLQVSARTCEGRWRD
jgi:transposase